MKIPVIVPLPIFPGLSINVLFPVNFHLISNGFLLLKPYSLYVKTILKIASG